MAVDLIERQDGFEGEGVDEGARLITHTGGTAHVFVGRHADGEGVGRHDAFRSGGEELFFVGLQLELVDPMTRRSDPSAAGGSCGIETGMETGVCPYGIDGTEMVGTEQQATTVGEVIGY